ncbi:YciI family protein [Streptomyces sp. NPDC059853]|uniref:YciI family protein n=1 Tax=Streptomyces sp. NPDC059853 TaxID=3346973 RepID=UPI0036617F79
MLFVLRLRYTATEEDAAPFVAGHVAFLERHHRTGTFLLSGQTVPTSDGGVILAHGPDLAAMERLTAEDPFVANGAAAYTITAVTPGRAHPALTEALTRPGD